MNNKKYATWFLKCFLTSILWGSVLWAFLFFSAQIFSELMKKLPGGKIQVDGSISSLFCSNGKLGFLCKDLTLLIGNSQLKIDIDRLKLFFSPSEFFKKKEYFFSAYADNVKLTSTNDPLTNKVLIRFLKSAVLNETSAVSEVLVDNLTIDIPLVKDLLANDSTIKLHFKKKWQDSAFFTKKFNIEFFPNQKLCPEGKKFSLLFDENHILENGQTFKKLTGQIIGWNHSIISNKFFVKGLFNKKDFFLSIFNRENENVLLAQGPLGNIAIQATLDSAPVLNRFLSSEIQGEKKLKFKGNFSFGEQLTGRFALSPNDYQRMVNKIPLAWGCLDLNKEKSKLQVMLKTDASAGNISLNSFFDLEELTMITNCNVVRTIETGTFFKLNPGTFFVDSKLNPSPQTHASCNFFYTPRDKESFLNQLSGSIEFNRTGICNFCLDKRPDFSAKASFYHLENFQVKELEVNSFSNKLVELSHDSETSLLEGFLDFKAINLLAPKALKNSFFGSFDKINFKIKKADLSGVCGHFCTDHKGSILPVKTANSINKISGEFDCDFRLIRADLNDLKIGFSVGSIYLPSIQATFSKKFELSSLYAPICANNLLINKDNEFFAIMDASVLASKIGAQPLNLAGNVLLVRSVYKNNYGERDALKIPDFLDSVDPENNASLVDIDLSLKTQRPFEVNTVHLNAFLDLDLQLKGQLLGGRFLNPKITGNAEILSGNLLLLGNSFEIKNGSLKFYELLGSSPFIDILACGKVKKYELDFHALGCLTNPSIHLQSSPELSEEQIVGLLMSGFDGQDTSLMQFLPGILIKQIEDVVSEDTRTSPKVSRAIRAVTSPARTLKISPCLIDSKLDNIGAAISLDIGPRLHASAKKGVHGRDHLSLQMEYLLSDNLSLKVGRGSEGDVQGELEMKFKF